METTNIQNQNARNVASMAEIAEIVKSARKQQRLTQADLASKAHTGVRFIVDLESGKPTCQIGKVLQVMTTLGLIVTVARGA